jgi:hypothetical protein
MAARRCTGPTSRIHTSSISFNLKVGSKKQRLSAAIFVNSTVDAPPLRPETPSGVDAPELDARGGLVDADDLVAVPKVSAA